MGKETNVDLPGGDRVTVRTDHLGTQDHHSDGKTGTTSGSDRHQEHVDRHVAGGGTEGETRTTDD